MPADAPLSRGVWWPAAKRGFDLALALPATVVLLPLIAVLSLWVRLDSPGPVFFRQERVGRFGASFRVWKLRTMSVEQVAGAALVTSSADARITRCGRILRRHKLDELPQLFNVIAGQMSLVGPRPEVAKYVAHYPEDVRAIVLSVRPGLTDRAALEFRDEERLLAQAGNPEQAYVSEILPRKLALYRRYVEDWSLMGDVKLVLETLGALAFPR